MAARWAVLAIVAGLAVVVMPARPATAACAKPTGTHTGATPWAQRLLGAEQVWPLTRGDGVTVAVLGTGVDARHPQFADGQIRAGEDVARSRQRTTVDCDGRGTFAAGLIGAQPRESTTFAGLAPGARIVSIRYTEAREGSTQVAPNQLAKAINAAVERDVDVICVVAPSMAPSDALADAVEEARAAGAVVVSPATGESGASSYPTAADGVIAVGAVAADGEVVSSESGDYIDLAAPGDGLISTAANGDGTMGHIRVDDPAFAAAYVAGAAALLRSYRPRLSADAVAERLRRTASRVSNEPDPQLGWGVVDPYAAVTVEGLGSSDTSTKRTLPTTVAPAKRPPGLDPRAQVSVAVAAGGLGLAGLLGLGVHVYRRGRQRRWIPSRRSLAEYEHPHRTD